MTTTSTPKREEQRLAQIIRVKPEHIAEYVRIHNPIPEPIERRIRECNIIDYSIFHDPQTNLLFASFKYIGSDYQRDMERMRSDPETLKWWKVTDAMQESLNVNSQGSTDTSNAWWTPCREVFRQA
ncbi:Putative uncharacterized protein [Taphrina deformans PYCC 5710]|uniref:DUF718 domain protein n=1 Tax=Taphrina deformans (strain PYCC 5710 / ATCC 11124 / CBS 356.35 / IMI 108563 / JCM 9778 / NBRC 8474) TaxID=1097556 RepID=R4X772_TAPDE|nr:Putative uncharacterized protein [Taphrina deformans PYCC 5710]|eukprot:CCG80908.1 Putative uncharacterized protein [Taphrina deformans PYCC 5710]